MNLDESYKTLRLKPGASLQEVKRAYYEGVKFFHPDRHQGSPGLLRRANEETKKLNLGTPLFNRSNCLRRWSKPTCRS